LSSATRLGVLGWPVLHSRSPAMHNAALAQVGLSDWRYQLLPVPAELFAETVAALPAAGFRGANVTIPHKRAALALSDEASGRALAIGAANTLIFGDGGVWAENTDAPALIAALPLAPAGAGALVLGAGGSARSAVWALLDAGAETVWVWNRTPETARELCEELGAIPVGEPRAADLLVNCTPAWPRLLGGPDLAHYRCVVDFAYGEAATPLVRAARERGIPAVDGLELLVQQGALSFELFTSRPAPIKTMRSAAIVRPQ
jgi:shikimate dehydrogenase